MRQLKISESITNRNHHSLSLYLTEVGKFELLSSEEEVELAKRIREGDLPALVRLTNANLRFVISVAKQYQYQGVGLEDLINEGNLGLIKAAQRFDETKGFKFISYAVWWIRQSILVAIAVHSRIIRIPGNQITNLLRLKKSQSYLEQQLEREPSNEELALDMSISVDKIADSLQNAERYLSVDAPSGLNEHATILDTLQSPDAQADQELMDDSLIIYIRHIVDKLSDRERRVLVMYYGLFGTEPHTLEEIASKLSLTCERIRQLKAKALSHIKGSSLAKQLSAYL